MPYPANSRTPNFNAEPGYNPNDLESIDTSRNRYNRKLDSKGHVEPPIVQDHYNSGEEFRQIFIDKKALDDIPIAGINYIFFTPPELGLTTNTFNKHRGTKVAIPPDKAFESNQRVLKLPNGGKGENNDYTIYDNRIIDTLTGYYPFMPILSNRAIAIPASSEQLDTIDYSETWNKYKIPLGTSTKDSKISGNFELPYKEDSDLTIMKLHKLWIDYIEAVFMGRAISPYATHTDFADSQNMIIDYMASCYVFSLKPDGKTIQYWAKYTGVFPTKNPYEIFSVEDGALENITRVSIDYQFAYKEDMDINIFRDFNMIASGDGSAINKPQGPYYDENITGDGIFDGKNSNFPRVERIKPSNNSNDKSHQRLGFQLLLEDPTNRDGSAKNY